MSIREQALSGLKWTAGGKLVAQIITWAITLVVIRLLTPEDYGLLAMASVFVAFMLMMSEAGLAPALIQKQDLSETSLRNVFAIVIVINLGLMLLLNLLAPAMANFFDEDRLIPILQVLSLRFLLSIFGTLPSVRLYRDLKFKHLSLMHLAATILGSILTLILAFVGLGVWALVLGNLLTSLFNVVTLNVIAPIRLLPNFSLQGMRSLLVFGGNITLSRLLWFFFTQIDVIIVGKLLGKEMLGFYSVSMQLASLPVQRVSSIVNQVAFPVFSRIQSNLDQFRQFVLKAIRILSLIAFPVLWGISSVANEMVLLLLGEKWETAILPLQLLALMMPFRMIANFLPSATDALGRPDIGMKNVLLATTIMPVALIIGVQDGIVGVAVTWATIYPFILFINYQRSLKVLELKFSDFLYAILPAIGSALGMYIAVRMLSLFLVGYNLNQLTALLIMIASGVFVYFSFTLLINQNSYKEAVGLLQVRRP
ncbi:lipopolysaccharide biosynthesis protein [Nitrosomonas halophila]|uniref:Membrane protein involved in the export of O-antigen and teichoic acid n=1 Tax=Nitrosomonas halophila TaxID=44576 RepID=A0A1H3KCT7_9PROT|nr:lipopolysaccharide biosynthesis protein [Nitrosomonas halophila]SDY49941.1 Membrane protein involved in the export of O-antigen and teichoic acid [Nitrosomonas halophila]